MAPRVMIEAATVGMIAVEIEAGAAAIVVAEAVVVVVAAAPEAVVAADSVAIETA
jgi:hypothetical protein